MNTMRIANLFFTSAVLALPASTCPLEQSLGLSKSLHTPPSLSITEDRARADRYESTECVQFQTLTLKSSVGYLCATSSEEFLADAGIFSALNDEPKDATTSRSQNFTVGTPMSEYAMTPRTMNGHTLYTASVDCDVENTEIYRASGTCQVALMPLENGRFLYSNFIVKNHVKATTYTNESDILALWKSVQPAK